MSTVCKTRGSGCNRRPRDLRDCFQGPRSRTAMLQFLVQWRSVCMEPVLTQRLQQGVPSLHPICADATWCWPRARSSFALWNFLELIYLQLVEFLRM